MEPGAALEKIRSGVLRNRKDQVLAMVTAFPGRTHGEYAALMYRLWPDLGILCCAETPHKRLAELYEKKKVYPSGIERKCRQSGRMARAWYPTGTI